MRGIQNPKECDICGKELELLQEIDTLCNQDIELKVLVYRKFLRIPIKTVITRPVGPFINRVITRRIDTGAHLMPLGSLSPIFNKPSYI